MVSFYRHWFLCFCAINWQVWAIRRLIPIVCGSKISKVGSWKVSEHSKLVPRKGEYPNDWPGTQFSLDGTLVTVLFFCLGYLRFFAFWRTISFLFSIDKSSSFSPTNEMFHMFLLSVVRIQEFFILSNKCRPLAGSKTIDNDQQKWYHRKCREKGDNYSSWHRRTPTLSLALFSGIFGYCSRTLHYVLQPF